MRSTSKKKNHSNAKKKKFPKKEQTKPEDNFLMSCSRDHMNVALQLIEEKMDADRDRTLTLKVQKCKSIPGIISGAARGTKFMPCSVTHKSVQLRNALISHNWRDASFLLLNMLKDPKDPLLFRNIWKAFFLILQYSPNADNARMGQFRQLCQKITGKDNLIEAVYLH